MSSHNGTTLKKMSYNGEKVKKWYHDDVKVYSAGGVVTYYVDDGVIYQEEVDSEASCLSPKTFTPLKSGWSFVGWREDTAANGSVLTSKVMGDTPITLYAVFSAEVTVTYYNNSTSASSTKGARYYNNGNTVNPTFKLVQASVSGWSARGWSGSAKGNADILYNNNTDFTRGSDATIYGSYQKTVTLSYNGNGSTGGSTTSHSETAYRNYAGTVVKATFTLKANGFSRMDYTFNGWDLGAVGATVTLDGDKVAYAQWKQSSLTLFNGGTFYHDFSALTSHGDDNGLNYDEGQYANWNKNSGLYMGAYAYYYRISWVTTEKIDVTNLKTLNFTISGLTRSGSGGLWLMGLQDTRIVAEDWRGNTEKYKVGASSSLTNGQTLSFDVSSLSGSYYVVIHICTENISTLCFTATKGWFDVK